MATVRASQVGRSPAPPDDVSGRRPPVLALELAYRIRQASGGDRSGEQEALPEAATELPQHAQLITRLDALGDHVEPECAPDLEHGLHNLAVARAVRDLGHERAVDLEGVEGEAPKAAERGIPRPEVVDDERYAQVAERR